MTENVSSADPKLTATVLAHLKHLRVGVILDDFGTGNSSLSGLRQFPVDALKIDRSLIGGMLTDRGTCDTVELIILLAHKLKLKVIAEGIENSRQLDHLLALGCDLGQGYLFSAARRGQGCGRTSAPADSPRAHKSSGSAIGGCARSHGSVILITAPAAASAQTPAMGRTLIDLTYSGGAIPTHGQCSQCGQVFCTPLEALADPEKATRDFYAAFAAHLCRVPNLARSLVILKYKDRVPIVASCTACHRKFFTVATLLHDPRGAEQYLLEAFDLHQCSRDVSFSATQN